MSACCFSFGVLRLINFFLFGRKKQEKKKNTHRERNRVVAEYDAASEY